MSPYENTLPQTIDYDSAGQQVSRSAGQQVSRSAMEININL